MIIASRRTVQVAGRAMELIKTSFFQGRAQQVSALFFRSSDHFARLVFRRCPDAQIDRVLRRVQHPPSK